jgi:myo-inositol catabolism protein IolC
MFVFLAAVRSGRPIEYVQLRPLRLEQYQSLFDDIPIYKFPTVQQFVADINGHPRTLYSIRQLLRQRFTKSVEPSRIQLLEAIIPRLGINDFRVPKDVVIKALLGKEVRLDDRTVPKDPNSLPYSYYVAQVRILLVIVF